MSSGKHRKSILLGVSALVMGMAALVFTSGPQSDVVKWTRQDPGNAGQWVLDQRLSEAEREDLLSLVFKVWISKDRDAAAAWAEDSINRGTMDEALMNRVATLLQP
jgi:hypothetical protein